jgi:hypothetical protein
MIPDVSPAPLVVVATIRERHQHARLESLRDFLGVAAGVAVGGLVWLGVLSLAR